MGGRNDVWLRDSGPRTGGRHLMVPCPARQALSVEDHERRLFALLEEAERDQVHGRRQLLLGKAIDYF